MAIDEWKLKMERAPPTEEDAIPQLDNLRYRAMWVLSCMGPAIEAFKVAPAHHISEW